MIPTPWPEAGLPPNNNMIGTDPQLADPAKLDFTLKGGSPAIGYGCQTFASPRQRSERQVTRWTGIGANGRAAAPYAGEQLDDATPATCARLMRNSLEVSGDITVDALWDADTMRVTGDVTVVYPATLTVAEGVRVVFDGHHSLTVLGRILAIGTPCDPILFTTDEPEAFAPDSTTTGCWGGIRFPWTSAAAGESRLEWCTIEYAKSVDGDALGGAISTVGFSNLVARNCVFRSNVASYGGAVACTHQASPAFVNCLFENNYTLWHGSAVYSEYAYPDLIACTFAGNHVSNGNQYELTGVVHSHIGKPAMTGSVVWGNISPYYLPGELAGCKPFYTTYSCIEEGLTGTGNIDMDPLFAEHGTAPFSPVPWSPCVNTGPADTAGLRLPATDLVDGTRILEGRVDMGCYEPEPVTDVDDDAQPVLTLHPAVPNPARGLCELAFSATVGTDVSLELYDIAGRHVRTLRSGPAAAGLQTVEWDGRNASGEDVASGVYLARLSVDGLGDATSKIVLVR